MRLSHVVTTVALAAFWFSSACSSGDGTDDGLGPSGAAGFESPGTSGIGNGGADNGGTTGASGDGGTLNRAGNGGTSQGGSSNGGASDGGTSTGGASDGGMSSGGMSGAGTAGATTAGFGGTDTGGASGSAGSGTAGTGIAGSGTGGSGTAGSSGSGGAGGDTGVVVPTCEPFGAVCATSSDCCSDMCNATTKRCDSPLTVCAASGASCTESDQCCSLNCSGGKCSAVACLADGESCSAGGTACCGGTCQNGACKDINGPAECQTAGNPCTDSTQCCSQLCGADNRCVLGASYCAQRDDVCSKDADCCTGMCNKASATDPTGYCGAEPDAPSRCSSGGVDGTVCNSCGFCCSRVCAPFGPTGVSICQPPSGCRVNGSLCTKNEDCCGGDPTLDLPGAGNVICDKSGDPSGEIGRCRNPNGCTPQGGVCHYKDSYCSDTSTSAPNNCCSYLGNASNCRLDALGVPRCNALTECRTPGEDCASSDDCCNGLPCVPDSGGHLRCYEAPTGPQCVPSGGSCTNNGDCCVGTLCNLTPGAGSGICGVPTPTGGGGSGGTSGTGGSGGSGATSGSAGTGGTTGSAGTSGAGGASGSGGTTGTGGSPSVCAAYGQRCGGTSECCNSDVVKCYNGICRIPPG